MTIYREVADVLMPKGHIKAAPQLNIHQGPHICVLMFPFFFDPEVCALTRAIRTICVS